MAYELNSFPERECQNAQRYDLVAKTGTYRTCRGEEWKKGKEMVGEQEREAADSVRRGFAKFI